MPKIEITKAVAHQELFKHFKLGVQEVTDKQREVLIRDGYARDVQAGKPAGEGAVQPADLTVAQLKEQLTSAGVEIPKGAKKADLVELLVAQQAAGSDDENQADAGDSTESEEDKDNAEE